MNDAILRADCSRCAGLCCVALAFDKSSLFAIDKAAGVPCPNLERGGGCTIHESLRDFGFEGCARYTCHGAGQRVTQELFPGLSWRDDPSMLPAMMEAFRVLRRVHELLLLIGAAGELPLSRDQRRTLSQLAERLQPIDGWSVDALVAFEKGSTDEEAAAFLASLRPLVEAAE